MYEKENGDQMGKVSKMGLECGTVETWSALMVGDIRRQ